ncbi:hypothetical protein ACF0H5_010803 [Mactra antiquata]
MTETGKMWYTIDKQLLPVKGIYFFFLAAVGDLLPFITIYMRQLGLSSTEAGIIYGVMPFISFFVRPLVGALADKTRRHKLTLMICLLFTGICYCLLLVTPAKSTNTELRNNASVRTHLECNVVDSYLKDCTKMNNGNNSDELSLPMCQHSLTQFWNNLGSNSSIKNCTATCGLFYGDHRMHACFTNSISGMDGSCDMRWNDSGVGDHLVFGIDNISAVLNNVVLHGESNNDQSCNVYDLKNVSFQNQNYWQFTCDSDGVFECEISCGKEYEKTCITVKDNKLSQTFWIFFLIFLLGNIFFSPVFSVIDAIVYDILGERRGDWGKQRLWGTVGFALFAVASTFIMDMLSKSNKKVDYSVSFYIFLGLCVISTVITYFLKFSETLHCRQMFTNVITLLKYPKVVAFLIVMAFFGIFNAVIEAFLFWYLLDLGSSQILLGLCLLTNTIPEIIMLHFAGKIIKKIGHIPCLYLGFVGFAIRFFGYSFLTQAWYVLLIEPFHCLTFALQYAAASAYASIITPEGMSATVQGLIGGIYFGFGKGIGSLVTGKLFDPITGFGEVWTFRFYGFVAVGVGLIYGVINVLFFSQSSDPHTKHPDSSSVPGPDGDTPAVGDKLLEKDGIVDENSSV